MLMKKFHVIIVIRTRDPPDFGAVPQPNAPQGHVFNHVSKYNFYVAKII
jgi:hypothetical protein